MLPHGLDWIWEQWQLRGTPHFPKLQHEWSLTKKSLVSYPGHSLVGSYPFAEMQSEYSAASADWTTRTLVGDGVLPLSWEAVGVFNCPNLLGNLQSLLSSSSSAFFLGTLKLLWFWRCSVFRSFGALLWCIFCTTYLPMYTWDFKIIIPSFIQN